MKLRLLIAMKLLCSLVLIMALLIISGCDSNPSDSISLKRKQENCVPPQNPYNDGGGHDAGFNWAMEGGTDCNGNSDSFNEGCFEYYSQLDRYNECVRNSRE